MIMNIRRVMELKLIQVIVVEGKGIENDPIREVFYYFLPDGRLLAVKDEVLFRHPAQDQFAPISKLYVSE